MMQSADPHISSQQTAPAGVVYACSFYKANIFPFPLPFADGIQNNVNIVKVSSWKGSVSKFMLTVIYDLVLFCFMLVLLCIFVFFLLFSFPFFSHFLFLFLFFLPFPFPFPFPFYFSFSLFLCPFSLFFLPFVNIKVQA